MNLASNTTTKVPVSSASNTRTLPNNINVLVCPATGGQHNITVSPHDTITELKRKISRQIHIPQERLKLLFNETVLLDGKIMEHNLHEGCKITLLPVMKCGFSSTVQGPQQSIIQAIEGLSDDQIDDFLSGRAPLTLALRAGDHIMFVQLHVQHCVANNSSSSTTTAIDSRSDRHCKCDQWKCLHAIREMMSTTPSVSTNGSCNRNAKSDIPSHKPSTSKLLECDEEKNSRKTRTYGRITSGVGSLSHPGSFGTGSRFLRQIQRLRRLCGGHQQCVAYSSREVASEISSIVHSSKHTMSSDGDAGGKHSSRDHARKSGSARRDTSSMTSQSYATRIDSVTAHGPGVFSGTFSGTLDSSVQDEQGTLKRDPSTVLRILTELLAATDKYEKQTGNVSVLSQLFKDHFSPTSSRSDAPPTSSSTQESKPSSQRKRSYSRVSGSSSSKSPLSSHRKMARFCPCSSLVKDSLFSSRGEPVTSSRLLTTCHRLHQSSSSCRNCFHIIQAIKNNPRIQKLRHENDKTEMKLAYLRHVMEEKRKLRLQRKHTSAADRNSSPDQVEMREEKATKHVEASMGRVRRPSIEVQVDNIAQYSDDRKADVTHEAAETVTV